MAWPGSERDSQPPAIHRIIVWGITYPRRRVANDDPISVGVVEKVL